MTPPSTGLHATSYGANGWLLEFGALRVLVDPWLTGSLVFPPGPWLFRGELPSPWPVPPQLDLLLLTQGLADHAHGPSLELLPRSLPVVASPGGAAVAQALGFAEVVSLRPGQSHGHQDLRVTATAGAPVPQVENGYLLHHPQGCLYIEPHGYLDPDLRAERLDAVITPVVNLGLPLVGAFVRGQQVLPALVSRFSPATVLASSAGGAGPSSGWLTRLIWQQGTAAEAQELLGLGHGSAQGTPTLIDPIPGERYGLVTSPGGL